MTEDRLVILIARRLSGELASEEVGELEAWSSEKAENQLFLERVLDDAFWEEELIIWNKLNPVTAFEKWEASIHVRRRTRVRRIGWLSAVASLLILVVLGDLWHNRTSEEINGKPGIAVSHIVTPGRNTATLTLANGQQILLDSVGQGVLTTQGESRIVKKDSGSLSYLASSTAVRAVAYNVLTTPRAGQFQVRLSDGTKVWLNNVSSLRYPTSFQGADRTVELNGEAYFEIAKDSHRPFFVKVKDATVEVLGTSFNVMAYADEGGTQATLLDGAVQVQTNSMAVKLGVNEQAMVKEGGKLEINKHVNGEDIISWKNGFFYFGRANFTAVMRQLARWYDITVVYEGKVPDIEFGGKIDRSLPLNELLKYLDQNQIHFRLQGRQLIVLSN